MGSLPRRPLNLLRWAMLVILGGISFIGLFAASTLKLGRFSETVAGPTGSALMTHIADQSTIVKSAGVLGLIGCLLIAVGAAATVQGKLTLAKVTLFIAVLASLTAGPIVIFSALFAGTAIATARARESCR